MEKGKVCVTGAAGYMGSWLVMKLLQQGYHVRATARLDPQYGEETSHLTSLPLAKERLEIFDADLSVEGSFDAAVHGCVGVFHLAAPTNYGTKDPENELIKPTVQGTLNVLKACLNSKTVRRTIYISSSSAVKMCGKELEEYDESIWSDVDFCRKEKMLAWEYVVSKTLAEKAAWDFAEQNNFDLVTVLPTFVMGPFLTPAIPHSTKPALDIFLGSKVRYRLLRHFVHIDDVASALIFLFESPAATGRYLCSSHDSTSRKLAGMLSKRYPEFDISTQLEGYEEEKPLHVSSKKLLSLGFEFKYSLEDMFEGAISCCKEKGLV